MKVRKPRLTDKNLSLRLKELYQICPFDLEDFYYENKDLVKKYIKKDTSKYQVDDWDREELPLHWWYMGREGLLAASVKNSERPYTIKQKLEWIKCAVDVVYFTRKYIKIISIDDGVIPFNLYDYQEELLYTYQQNRFVIGMQCRQSGKTQTTAAFITHFSIFNAAKTTAILANKASQAQEILERVQMSYEELPMFLQPGVKSYNKQSMTLDNKSKIFSAASSSSSIRGKSVSLLYIDEAAFINNDMTFYESTYPVIASGKNSRVIVTSTPNGTRGLFYKLWQESVSKTNEYVHKLVTWDMVPGRDEAWKRQTIANTSPEQFRQEHECHFRGSTNSLLSGNVLEQLVTTNPIRELNDGKISIYKEPIKAGTEITNEDGEVIEVIESDHTYLAVVDCSEGVGGDYHGIKVIDISVEPYEVVCVYHDNKLSPLLLPELIYNMCKHYNNAWVLVENESTGGQVANDLYYDLEYENVIFTVPEKGQQTPTYDVSGRIGVKMSRAVKRIGCANLKTMLESGRIIINHMETVNELGDFVPKGGSYAAADGAHDDLVMPLVMFGWISNTEFFKDLSSDVRKAMIEQIRDNQREVDIEPFGIIDDGNSVFTGDKYFERDELGFFDDPLDTYDDNQFILDNTFGEF